MNEYDKYFKYLSPGKYLRKNFYGETTFDSFRTFLAELAEVRICRNSLARMKKRQRI